MKKILNLAHRGASAFAPENTMSAFKKAIELNSDGIELDVQLSKDGHLVICHDETLDRTTTGKGFILDYSLEELKKLDAGVKFSKSFQNEKLPTLEEVLYLFEGTNLTLNIELKNSLIHYKDIEAKTLDLIKNFKLEDNVIISSFNHHSIKKVLSLNENVKTGILTDSSLYNPGSYTKNLGATFYHPNFKTLHLEDIEDLNKHSILINPYTINSKMDMLKLLKSNFPIYSIITNFPNILFDLLSN